VHALDGLKVLDLTGHVAGPYATKLLADLGADVVKVERPGGDPARAMGPFHVAADGTRTSLLFLYLNTNKRSIVLDLHDADDHATALDLVRWADVVVESHRPGVLDRLGLGYDVLEAVHPGIVLTSISNFGQTGPSRDLPASELVLYATSGMMAISGQVDREPLKHGLAQGQYAGGVNAAYATLAAVTAQELGLGGSWVDVSLQEVLASELVLNEPMYAWAGGIQGRRPVTGDGLNNLMPTKDGYAVVQVTTQRSWPGFIEAVDEPALRDERFATPEGRSRNAKKLDWLIAGALARLGKKEVFARATERRVLVGVAQDPSDLLECPHLAGRDYFVEVDHPATGPLRYPGAPYRMSGTPWRLRRRAPLLGEHEQEIRDALRAAVGVKEPL
jgi:crotonobetainyl-CoA:carnitine CoA-transferase CaiB-like acyl-CoA transferase